MGAAMTITWTPERIKAASELWISGKGPAHISRELGVTLNSFNGFMARNKELFPKRKKTNELAVMCVDLWDKGMSIRVIAETLGKTEGQIAGVVRRNKELFSNKRKSMKAEKSGRNHKNNRRTSTNANAAPKVYLNNDIPLDEYETSRLPGLTLMENDGCMYALTFEGPHCFCAAKRSLGSRYCAYHVEKTTGYKGIDISYRKGYDRNIKEVEVV